MSLETYKTHFSKNFNIAFPVMLSQLGHILVGVADSMMVGQLGPEPLGAISLSNSILGVVMLFGIGVSYSITPLIAAADGEGNRPRQSVVFRNGFVVMLGAGIFLAMLVNVASPLLYHMNQPEAVVTKALPYLGIVAYSFIPFMLFTSFKQYAEGLSFTKIATVLTVGANVINVILNYLLIYGNFGFPALGLVGAAYATFIARVLMLVMMAIYVTRSSWFNLPEVLSRAVEGKMIGRMLKMGVPMGMQFVFEAGAFGAAGIMMGWLGTKALAAHQIAISLAAVSYMMASGISAASTVRVGNQLGRGDIPNLRRAGFTSFGMGAVFMAFCALVFLLFPRFLAELFIQDEAIVELSAGLLIIAAFFQISDGLQVVALGALRGLADVKIPTLITLFAYWIIGLPVGYLLSFTLEFGASGVWYGLLIGLSVTAILLLIRFNYISLQKQAGKPSAEQVIEA